LEGNVVEEAVAVLVVDEEDFVVTVLVAVVEPDPGTHYSQMNKFIPQRETIDAPESSTGWNKHMYIYRDVSAFGGM
jgi:hypothetical protein